MRRGKQKVRISGVVTEIGRDKSPRKVNKEDRKSAGRRQASKKIVEQDPLALPKPKKTKAKAKPVLTKAARKQPAEPEEYEVEKIVDHKQMGRKISYRIRWRGWAAKDDTWQLEDDLNCAAILKKYKAAMGTASPKKKASAAAPASPKKRGRPSLNASKSVASPKKKAGVAAGRVTKAKGRGRPPTSAVKGSPKKKTKTGRPRKDREWEVEEVVAVRMTEAGLEEFYIKWKNYSSEENTWEPAENVANCTSAIYRFRKSQGDGPLNGSSAKEAGDDADDDEAAAAADEADDAGDKSTAADADQDENEEADKSAGKEVVEEDEDTNNDGSAQE